MIHKNVKALGWVSFFTDFASAMITPILPIFIVSVLQETPEKLGVILAISAFVSYFFRYFFGVLSDRFHKEKLFLIIGYGISTVTKPLLAFSHSWQSVGVLRGSERIGKAIRSASKDTMISDFSEKKSHGKTFGFHKMMDIAGELFGAFLIFLILFFGGTGEDIFRKIFLFTLLPGLFALIILIFGTKEKSSLKKEEKVRWAPSDGRFFPIFVLYFAYIFFLFRDSFFLLQAQTSGFSLTFLPLLVMVSTLIQTLSSFFIGKKIDEYGSKIILSFSFFSGILGTCFLYFHIFLPAFLFLGIFTVSSLNALRASISQSAKNKASVYGLFYAGMAISMAFGSVVTGSLWTHFGNDYALLFSLSGLTLTSLVFVALKYPK